MKNVKDLLNQRRLERYSCDGGCGRIFNPPDPFFVIAGDMVELGDKSAQLHHMLGQEFGKLNVHSVFGHGRFTESLVSGASMAGVNSRLFSSKDRLLSCLHDALSDGHGNGGIQKTGFRRQETEDRNGNTQSTESIPKSQGW